jgi:hypothetical protein
MLVAAFATAGLLTVAAGAATTPRFSAPVLVRTGYASNGTNIVVADFNRDGNLDLAQGGGPACRCCSATVRADSRGASHFQSPGRRRKGR